MVEKMVEKMVGCLVEPKVAERAAQLAERMVNIAVVHLGLKLEQCLAGHLNFLMAAK